MNQPWTILAEIAKTDSKLEKQAIIQREAEQNNIPFFKGLRYTFDPMITFGVKAIETKPIKRSSEPEPKGLDPAKFYELCEKLSTRKLTGDAAQVAIGYLRNQALQEEWDHWYRLILMKDLKAGFSEKTVNTVCDKKFKNFSIPTFSVQLAADAADEEGNIVEKLLSGKKVIENKLNGIRLISVVYPNGNVAQYSSNGKELTNFDKIRNQLSRNAVFFAEPTVLDGEIMSASFQDLMKQAHRKTNVDTYDSILHLFDILTLREFLEGKGEHKQLDRTFTLQSWFERVGHTMPNVTVVGCELVNLDTPEGKNRLTEINNIALQNKYEGIMIKDVDAIYECKRSKNWLKLKPYIEESLTVVDVEEGDPESKFVGTMGALICEGEVDGKKVKVHCGGGFSIQQRAQIWADHTNQPVSWKKKVGDSWKQYVEQPTKNSVIGLIAEIRADALTKPQNSETWSMRFPRFKTWRGQDANEKM
jgi:DNA ligase-1